MATPVGQGDGINGRGHIGRLASPTALLGTAVFLFTAFQLAVCDALARGGSGSHSFHSSGGGGGSSGGSGSSHFHNHFINNGVNGGGSSGGSAGVIVAIVVAVIVVVIVTFLVIRRRRQSKPA